MATEIENLQELMTQFVGSSKKIVHSDITNLTSPGENLLSVVLKVDLTIRDEETGKDENLHGVAKCIHSNVVHHIVRQFEKKFYTRELNWYTKIVPALQDFVKERELGGCFDLFPRLIAYRANLLGETVEVDENAVLLMENLIASGK